MVVALDEKIKWQDAAKRSTSMKLRPACRES
jgi:hypothetical protein